jgi:hypothetical protein
VWATKTTTACRQGIERGSRQRKQHNTYRHTNDFHHLGYKGRLCEVRDVIRPRFWSRNGDAVIAKRPGRTDTGSEYGEVEDRPWSEVDGETRGKVKSGEKRLEEKSGEKRGEDDNNTGQRYNWDANHSHPTRSNRVNE